MQDKSSRNDAILNRLRKLLSEQQKKFEAYIRCLKLESVSIQEDDAEKLNNQTLIEKEILSEIIRLQRVIEPLEELYSRNIPAGTPELNRLRKAVTEMRSAAASLNLENRNRIRERLSSLRTEISGLRIPKNRRSPYSNLGSPAMLDMTT
ncbi:MAG: hypothetical protein ACLFST_03455 [Spirochaetia bacterium]